MIKQQFPTERINTMCRCCEKNMSFKGPRICPECDHKFQGNGWDGIDAHWRAKHQDVMSYESFWNNLCPNHADGKGKDNK
jgi:hypothetical protein